MSYTLKENVFIAKKLIAELIYNSAYIEGVNVTFPQTQAIIDGAIVNGVSVNDIQTVLNLRDAYKYVLENIEKFDELTIEYICKINEYVSRNESIEWGVLRYGKVGISGTDYIPEIPTKENVEKYIETINKIKNPLERAIIYFISSTKKQLFWDGNKRTSIIVANTILISNGEGILTINEKNEKEYNELLNDLYNSLETGLNINEPITKKFFGFCKKEISLVTKRFFEPNTIR